jgi:hypothetical protein
MRAITGFIRRILSIRLARGRSALPPKPPKTMMKHLDFRE